MQSNRKMEPLKIHNSCKMFFMRVLSFLLIKRYRMKNFHIFQLVFFVKKESDSRSYQTEKDNKMQWLESSASNNQVY